MMAVAGTVVRVGLALLLVVTAWLFVALPALGFVLGSQPSPELEGVPRAHPESRFEDLGGLWHCHLAGTPLERGFACGSLTAPLMTRHEDELYRTLDDLVPGFPLRHFVLGLVTFNNRSLESFLLPDEIQAVAGIARGYREGGDPNAAVGPTYSRILGYHALHDAGQYLIDNPLVNAPQVGCSAVAVQGPRSADGHLLVARIFDFEGGRSFDLDKVVYTVDPRTDAGERRLRYVNVAWGGVHGAVTGLNEAGLWLSVNAGVSDGRAYSGRPLVVASLRVLETCSTIDEAVTLLAAHPVFVSSAILLASTRRTAGRPDAVCLEIGPGGHHVRPMEDDRLVVTNHFEHPAWSADQANATRQREGTTRSRSARLHELVDASAAHTPASLCDILRDRRGPGGRDLGFAHRSSINAWIGAHLVVADLDAGLLWVAEPEHGLGRARAFDVAGPRPDVAPLEASPDLELFERHGRGWKRALEDARRLVAARAPSAADRCRALIDVNPLHYEPHALLAAVTDDLDARLVLLRRALQLEPAYASERRSIVAEIERLEQRLER